MSRTRDFDQFFSEMKREPIRIKLFGQWEELPPDLPAEFVLRLMRLRKKFGDEKAIPEIELFEMATLIFGQERLDRWCQQGLSFNQLEEIMRWTMSVYQGINPDEMGNGKAPRQNRKRR